MTIAPKGQIPTEIGPMQARLPAAIHPAVHPRRAPAFAELLGKVHPNASPPRPARAGAERPSCAKPADAQPAANTSTSRAVHTRGDAHDRDAKDKGPALDDPTDPAARRAAQLAPPVFATQPVAPPPVVNAAEVPRGPSSMEHLVTALVRKIAWSGDGKRGTVRLELGAGRFEGATLIVHADEGRVHVSVDGRSHGDLDELRQRIESRLKAKGVALDGVE